MKRLTFTAIAAACLLAAPGMAMATNLLVITNTGYGGYGYGHSAWSGFSSDINNAIAASGGTVTTASALNGGVLGYDALMIVAAGIEKGGADRAAVMKYLTTLKGLKGVTGVNNFDENGDVIKDPIKLVVKDAKFQPYVKK